MPNSDLFNTVSVWLFRFWAAGTNKQALLLQLLIASVSLSHYNLRLCLAFVTKDLMLSPAGRKELLVLEILF